MPDGGGVALPTGKVKSGRLPCVLGADTVQDLRRVDHGSTPPNYFHLLASGVRIRCGNCRMFPIPRSGWGGVSWSWGRIVV
uniref:Uncharacterized protein n=1 Tax=Hyaloperonospora arabidopsidis (strain Emoy2) TaxID=559515 RepID=M4BBA6_HYAAE